ncbi:MAG: outer membrane lipoprotein-sorting protein [Myxococcota bacterium]|nr:outer membrane lipoprotein-sorting protein [Myxococcota bacterium]
MSRLCHSVPGVLTAALVACLFVAPSGLAEEPQQLLEQMDEASVRAKDLQLDYRVLNEIPGKAPRTMRLHVKTKGSKRITEFLAPGDMKGTKVLSLSREKMWVYLPAYQKVRRVASHATQQGFMGTTFSQDDMAIDRYAPVYQGAIEGQDDKTWTLKLTPRSDANSGYGHLVMVVRKDNHLPSEVRYFSEKGQHVKTQKRLGYSCESGVCNPEKLVMVDHTRGDAKTTMTRQSWKVNQGIPDKLFSVRNLQRAR